MATATVVRGAYGPGMTSLPTWAVYCVSFGTPLATFIGVLIGHVLASRSTDELDCRAKREESMRTLRWAGELALSGDVGSARVGLAALDALSASPWLQSEDQAFIDTVVAALANTDATGYRERGNAVIYDLDEARNARARSRDEATNGEDDP